MPREPSNDGERAIARELLEHQRQVNAARNIELHIQVLNHLHLGFRSELKKLQKYAHAQGVALVLQWLGLAAVVFAAYLVGLSARP